MSETWSCRSGDWFAIFGEQVAVLLPPSEKARAASLWELVDGGAEFDETLDLLISSGLRALREFVLVGRVGGETRVLVRGAAHAHFATADDVVHVAGDPLTTWTERSLRGVTRVRLEAPDAADDPDDPDADVWVDRGLVRVATAEWPSVRVEAGPDHDGQTRTGTEAPPPTLPGIPGQPPAPPITARPVARLRFSTGEVIDVDRVVLVGRAPEGRVDGTEQRLVSVSSPHQEISATHLEVRPGSGADHGSAVVTDLGSTNGTLLVQPGLPPEDLKAGVAVQLIPGAVIDLGDGVNIQVVNP